MILEFISKFVSFLKAYFSYTSIDFVFSELFWNLFLFIVTGASPSIAQGDRTELEIYIRDVITQLWQDWPNMCLPVSGTMEHISAPRCFSVPATLTCCRPQHNCGILWSELVPQLTVQFLKLVCCIRVCSYIGPISFCMSPTNGRNNLTFHLEMFKCDGFYMLDTIRPPYIGICVTYCANWEVLWGGGKRNTRKLFFCTTL